MRQPTRILIAAALIVALIAAVLTVENLRRASSTPQAGQSEPALAPGAVPIVVDGVLTAGFSPQDLDQLDEVSFIDSEEGKKQQGWLLRDVLLLHLDPESLGLEARVTVRSSSRDKSVDLTWAEVEEEDNMVMLDLSDKGMLKLVSLLEQLDTREEWIQDVDSIELELP